MNEDISIVLNGVSETIHGCNFVNDLLKAKSINPASIVVEINQCIVKREIFDTCLLHDGDRVEILRFVGGG